MEPISLVTGIATALGLGMLIYSLRLCLAETSEPTDAEYLVLAEEGL
jgi:hypothetical protein